ncbi:MULTISPECIES: phosphonate C-P lyase system protein PhnG [Burkholderia]|uniref:phosphonate C-P lyase system protein PhnG n=1 Tax=Burkholderia TaxID=32008 RepID=UPI00075EB925|nr:MULTISPECIES: phosphonate C-P lyase system protein PhnG [Burkholderia]AOJ73295.1 phosphonate C-P lyase system protein PhnG [Burkholderia savannae]AOK51021.1 phosphonate C-P lyase system protein PhnG [Burkholderia sp. MSMB617WGS]KVG45164.1 phosphonate C-P lyase system protein PhnG [Burkholderia sp. MSMB0265]KVG90017.1 phosphonate C-P lyase system protein PhnG [Burkholderia sp. MSMB2040]KVG96292.1 phosphonate C-P lyase system protein PhnG [Burkholderia sp. MSMB2041]
MRNAPDIRPAPKPDERLRADWLRVLALAESDELDRAMRALADSAELPAYRWVRSPEIGMTMVQGRAGGTGARFNLGEMTVTRCALSLPEGVVGIAYVQGRSARHAEQAALVDALMQSPAWHARVRESVVAPLAASRAARRARHAADVSRTRVDFFTLSRGDE